MKLIHQINLAFGVSLALMLTITAVVIHYVLLNHFIDTQKNDMRTMSASLTETFQRATTIGVLNEGTAAAGGTAALRDLVIPAYADIQAVITDDAGNVLSELAAPVPALPVAIRAAAPAAAAENNASPVTAPIAFLHTAEVAGAAPMAVSGTTGASSRETFLVQANPIPQGTLTLFTPMTRIKAIERELLVRLLLVFGAGSALMFGLSLLITKRLINPLVRLRTELRKIKARSFAEVELIRTGGEIGAVAQAVYDMAGELNKFIHVQKQFVQNASHELKTPLMSIAGYAEGIRDGVFEGEEARKGLDIILSESGRMTNIVTEMTLLAKLDSEEHIFRMSEVGVKELLAETAERVNPLLVRRGLKLHLICEADEELIIQGDQDKLLQALLNIVSNAIRHARREIAIQARPTAGGIEIAVTDDGPGIAEELLPYLFQRFMKGKDGESGLGLAIARAIVERCGGRITAGNVQGGGAAITLGFAAAGG
ncbi:HAMP domain-containing histidine kinase [Paenibacillus athensensis]|uniref:histidine kinase n=1 Tax=Paenibacillus athensensis TaxID=1967502 RepID=A0A4Y8PZ25_9BACL|nr:HAMP domain-containing sensor histidine kinase [Paenibacillus athensensis]MCD1260427.1 HAMP domain-containing histidine kinase [Paenibacillus athensensis]